MEAAALREASAQNQFPSKAAAPQPAKQSVSSSSLICLSEVPAEWTAEDLKVFHDSLDIDDLVGVKLLPSKDGGWTCEALLQYLSAGAAVTALASLMGRIVLTRSGARRHLSARIADGEGQSLFASKPPSNETSAKGRNKAHQNDEELPLPQPGPKHDPYTLYLADVPSDFRKQDLDRLHDQLGLSKAKVTKLLYPRIKNDKCGAILRYGTPNEASKALRMLHDRLVLVNETSGEEQHPRAQYAKKRNAGGYEERSQNQDLDSDSSNEPHKEDRFYTLPSVYLAELPVNITEKGVRHILEEVDGRVSDLVAVSFLQQKSEGSHRCCLLRYPDLAMAEEVAKRVHGFMVYHPDDRTRPLRAKLAQHARMFNQFCTDVYVGEVPCDWNASAVYRLLGEAGVERGAVHSMKLLSHRPGRASVGVILRVVDSSTADTVMEKLNGHEVLIRGKVRPLKARLADAPPTLPESADSEPRRPVAKTQNRRPRHTDQLQ